jgi:hypothetical protein
VQETSTIDEEIPRGCESEYGKKAMRIMTEVKEYGREKSKGKV